MFNQSVPRARRRATCDRPTCDESRRPVRGRRSSDVPSTLDDPPGGRLGRRARGAARRTRLATKPAAGAELMFLLAASAASEENFEPSWSILTDLLRLLMHLAYFLGVPVQILRK